MAQPPSASRVTHRHPLAPAPFGSRALWLHALWLPRPPRRARPLANAAARGCSDVDGSIPHQGLWPPERASAARHFFACAGLMQRQVIPQGPTRYPKTKWRTSEKKIFFCKNHPLVRYTSVHSCSRPHTSRPHTSRLRTSRPHTTRRTLLVHALLAHTLLDRTTLPMSSCWRSFRKEIFIFAQTTKGESP